MSQQPHDLLKAIVQAAQQQDYPDMKVDDYFEIFAAQQVLKSCDFDLDPNEVESGIVGGSDDGGVDGFYLFANRRLIREDTDLGIFKGQQLNIEVVVAQAKNKNSFEESVPQKMTSFLDECLRLGAPEENAKTLYSEGLRDAVQQFHKLYEASLTMKPTLSISYFHVAHSDDVHTKVETRGGILVDKTKQHFPTAKCSYNAVTGSELITLYHRQPKHNLALQTSKYFDWHTFGRQAYVCVVTLPDFYKFITNDSDEQLLDYIFDANVRDHAPDVKVNKGIQATLSSPGGDDFWWLNNGATIIASDAVLKAGALQIENPMIVNGLQTSYELFHHFKNAGGDKKDSRTIMVKVIVNSKDETSDRIINATNSQTKIDAINLHATERVQRTIETALKTAGYYYDRRKNFYRNQGKPAATIITIPFMAQALTAIVLQQPDHARARPGTVAEKNYKELFSDKYPVNLYPKCIEIVRRAQTFLSGQSDLSRADRLNLLFYLAMYSAAATLESVKPSRQKIAYLDVATVTESVMDKGFQWIEKKFRDLGGDDKAAKGPHLAEELRQYLVTAFGKNKTSKSKKS
jgi:AIPR protein